MKMLTLKQLYEMKRTKEIREKLDGLSMSSLLNEALREDAKEIIKYISTLNKLNFGTLKALETVKQALMVGVRKLLAQEKPESSSDDVQLELLKEKPIACTMAFAETLNNFFTLLAEIMKTYDKKGVGNNATLMQMISNAKDTSAKDDFENIFKQGLQSKSDWKDGNSWKTDYSLDEVQLLEQLMKCKKSELYDITKNVLSIMVDDTPPPPAAQQNAEKAPEKSGSKKLYKNISDKTGVDVKSVMKVIKFIKSMNK